MNAHGARDERIRQRTELLTGEPCPLSPRIWDDTPNYMSIERGHIVDLAGDLFSRRLRAWAEANGIPVEYGAPKVRKQEIAFLAT